MNAPLAQRLQRWSYEAQVVGSSPSVKKNQANDSLDTFIHELSDHTQIGDMITSTTASHGRGNLRGSRSSSSTTPAAAPDATQEEDED